MLKTDRSCLSLLRCCRWLVCWGLILGLTGLAWEINLGRPAHAQPPPVEAAARQVISREEAEQRLAVIAQAMESIRLCNRPGCRFLQINSQVHPQDAEQPSPIYTGEINAIIDRPAATLDKAHYQLEFREGRWRLLGGEELSDVSSFFFDGDEYEVFSSYSGRTRIEKLQNASPNLRIGYGALYFQIMQAGVEKLAPDPS
ncbi:MAG: hypothetical protein NW237_16800 [Cyanobacteriota bacterium]|nr:hypothetical protein [Cyanobacteriota bacterium]